MVTGSLGFTGGWTVPEQPVLEVKSRSQKPGARSQKETSLVMIFPIRVRALGGFDGVDDRLPEVFGFHVGDGGVRRSAGGCDFAAKLGGRIGGTREQFPRAGGSLDRHRRGIFGLQTHLDARANEILNQEIKIRRPRAAQRRDRVDLVFRHINDDRRSFKDSPCGCDIRRGRMFASCHPDNTFAHEHRRVRHRPNYAPFLPAAQGIHDRADVIPAAMEITSVESFIAAPTGASASFI